jgi:uncharacterized membrane protein
MARSSKMPAGLHAFLQNRPLRWGLLAGVATAIALWVSPVIASSLMRWLVAWDVAVAVYLAVLILKMRQATTEHIIQHAAETDEGRGFILFVSLTGVLVSIAAIVMEAGANATGSKLLHVGFVFLTVALSWLFIHTTLAAHYLHEYYGPDDDGKGERHGLLFPGGDETPDFWDFWHFALVIGVANQTADVQITSKAIRRIVTLHGIAAFVFNTVILALTINFAAGLIQ